MKKFKKKDHYQNLRLFRSSEPIKSVLMWGVNYSMTQILHVVPKLVLFADDFKSFVKVKVTNFYFDRENMPENFSVKEYCPMVFHYLRQRFGVEPSVLLRSFTQKQPIWSHPNAKPVEKYLVSYNKLFFVKLISAEEVGEMHRLLISYHEYLVKNSFKSLLPQYLAMYRLTFHDQDKYLVIIRNIYSPRIKLEHIFDIRGSNTSRKKRSDLNYTSEMVKYDVDIIQMNIKIHLGNARNNFMNMLNADVEFLQSKSIMDYSLLVGMSSALGKIASMKSDTSSDDDTELSLKSGVPFDGSIHKTLEWSGFSDKLNGRVYFMSIVDVLTKYGMKKMTANTYKSVMKRNGSETHSNRPITYGKRFLKFIGSIIVE